MLKWKKREQASSFRNLKSLKIYDNHFILKKVDNNSITVCNVNTEAKRLKEIEEVQEALLTALGGTDWQIFKSR